MDLAVVGGMWTSTSAACPLWGPRFLLLVKRCCIFAGATSVSALPEAERCHLTDCQAMDRSGLIILLRNTPMRLLSFFLFGSFVSVCRAYAGDIVSMDVVKIDDTQAIIRITNTSGEAIKLSSSYTRYEFSKEVTPERVKYSWTETARGDLGPKNQLIILARGKTVEFTVPISRVKGTKVAIRAADMTRAHKGHYSSFDLIVCPPVNGLD